MKRFSNTEQVDQLNQNGINGFPDNASFCLIWCHTVDVTAKEKLTGCNNTSAAVELCSEPRENMRFR